MEMPRQRISCRPGRQFGSRYPGDPLRLTLLDFLPDPQLEKVVNLEDFAGMLVFENWMCATNGRQTLFRRPPDEAQAPYKTIRIDQGFCFNAGEWNFPDAPLRGLYARNRVDLRVIGRESFEPWMERVEHKITEKPKIGEAVSLI
jgi:hypothetical protein